MSSSPGDAVLYGVAKLMKTPKIKQSSEPDLEGVAELFEVLEMASPIPVSRTPSLRRASDRVSIVSPLPINKTPSLRMKESSNDVVFPLQLSSTPSLRNGTENLIVASAEEQLHTPSLRSASEILTVVLPEQPGQTPSLRQREKNLTVVAAETPKHTPSLKKAAENISVSSPLQASVTPSLKGVPITVVAASPVPSTSPTVATEIAKSNSTMKQSKTVAVVSPFPVQSTPPPEPTSPTVSSTPSENQLTTVEPSLPQQILPPDELTTKLTAEEPTTSETTVAKRSTRSKRKAEPETLPAAKRPRRATSRSNTAKVVPESEIELPNGTASTRSSKSVVTSDSQVQRRTRAKTVKQPPVSVDTEEKHLQQPVEVVDLEEPAEDKVVSKSKRTTRARRPAEPTPTSVQHVPPQVQPAPVTTEFAMQSILFSEDLTCKPPTPTDEEATSKTTRSTRSKCIVESDAPQVAKRPRRTTSRNNKTDIEIPSGRASTRSGNTDSKSSVESAKVPKKTRASSTKQPPEKSQQQPLEVIDVDEVVENETDSKRKRNTRASRRKVTNEKAKGQSNSKSNSTPKIPTRSGKSKNVAGIPETPQHLEFTRTKLDPIIEVPTPLPTPASSLRGSSVKKSLLESHYSKDIITVIEEVVEPVVPTTSDETCVAKQETVAKGRVSRGKRAVAAEKSVGKSNEAKSETVPNEKRVTRAKRGIAAVVVLENSPGPKRQKKETVEAKVGDGKTAEQEKRGGGRKTRRTAQGEKVVEELTISNTRSTRRKKPAAVKEVEIVEETVVKYTRTTRQKAKPVEESASVEKPVEGRGKRTRKGNSGSETIEEDSGSRRKTRTIRQKQDATQNENVENAVEKEVKGGRTRSKRPAKGQEKVTEPVTRVTRSRRGAK